MEQPNVDLVDIVAIPTYVSEVVGDRVASVIEELGSRTLSSEYSLRTTERIWVSLDALVGVSTNRATTRPKLTTTMLPLLEALLDADR